MDKEDEEDDEEDDEEEDKQEEEIEEEEGSARLMWRADSKPGSSERQK